MNSYPRRVEQKAQRSVSWSCTLKFARRVSHSFVKDVTTDACEMMRVVFDVKDTTVDLLPLMLVFSEKLLICQHERLL